MIGSYFCSWSSKWSYQKEELDIKDVDSDIVYISFAQPDCDYKKGSFEGTGLSFSSSFEVVSGACELLKETKTVMLSVGGGTYHGWSALNVDALIALADDLHCKGIDIDWEPQQGAASAHEMAGIIDAFRAKYTGFLSFATAHVGAYGQGAFISSQPISMYTGVNYPGLIESGHKLDWLNVMAYDAGPTFDPLECYDSYKAIFSKKIYMGIEIGDQAWGGVITTLSDVEKLYSHIKDKGDDLFIWSWLKPGPFTFQQVAEIVHATPKIIITQPEPTLEPELEPEPPLEPEPQPEPPIEPEPPLEPEPQKRPIDQVQEPEVQPDKPKDTTPELPIPEIPIFEPKLPVIERLADKVVWEPALPLHRGILVFYKNATYKCRIAHSAIQGWEPDVAIALFTLVKDPLKTDWMPQMEYHTNETVIHKGKKYTCVAGHVSQSDWEPGMVGLWR
jgi:chitinase